MKERFKITIKDRKTGEEVIYYAFGPGFTLFEKVHPKLPLERPQVVKLILDHPRKEIKEKSK
jgi:hypothetical protein